MDMRRSFYLAPMPEYSNGLESDNEWRRSYSADVPYVIPANDNVQAKVTLSARCRMLIRRLIDLHSLG